MRALLDQLASNGRYRAFPIHLFYFSRRTLRLLLSQAELEPIEEFTVGLGLEGLILRSASPPSVAEGQENKDPRRKRFNAGRRLIKGAILGTGLGENLCVIAQRAEVLVAPRRPDSILTR